jgi:hypothetical protein
VQKLSSRGNSDAFGLAFLFKKIWIYVRH